MKKSKKKKQVTVTIDIDQLPHTVKGLNMLMFCLAGTDAHLQKEQMVGVQGLITDLSNRALEIKQ